jgi:hypothetical protein
MHPSRIWIVLGCWVAVLGPGTVYSTVVYRWVDAQGVIHYSDQPVEGAEKVTTSTGKKGIGGTVPQVVTEEPKPKGPKLSFAQFAITSPGPQETITGNQPVLVHLALAPELTSTQNITWFLNGQPLVNQAPDAVQFTLEDLPRGTYSLSATVTDQSTGDAKSADPVTFFVVRPSLLSPTHK